MTKPKTIDLDAMAYRDTGTCKIKHPVSKEIIGRIECHSPRSPVMIAFDDDQTIADKKEDREYSKARIDHLYSGAPEPSDPAIAREHPVAWRERQYRRFAAMVISADFEVKIDGKSSPFNSETAFAVFSNPRNDWMTVQFIEYVSKTENFTPNSATD